MKYREYSIVGGGAWYEVIVCSKRFSRYWWQAFWECGIMGNLSYYATKWFGWKPWLSPKQRRYLDMLDRLE